MKKGIKEKLLCGVLSFSMCLTGSFFTGKRDASAEQTHGISLKKAGDSVEYTDGNIVVDGNNIRTDNVNGLTYKGFGMLSANSTSDLLLDYKEQNPESYLKLMKYLFGGNNPIMTHVKIEMGNDRNNSTGSESSTKRTKDEQTNILRNPGFQIAADAKKINPNLKISILCWEHPTWVSTTEDKYTWYKEAILAAYDKFGYMVDYINPNYNEKWVNDRDLQNTKDFYKLMQQETEETIGNAEKLKLFKNIKLIVSDEAGVVNNNIYKSLKEDPEFYEATSVIGYHYNPNDDSNGGMKLFAEKDDKEVWVSEAQATFSDTYYRPANNVKDPNTAGTGIGGTGSALEMGNTFIKSFFLSRRSHVIYQPVVGSFYEGDQYSYKELISARDPWSGYMHFDTGLLILAHLSKFAKTGWENEDNTNGIWRVIPESTRSTATGDNPVNGRNGKDNYMTLADPDKSAFSTVIINDSEYEKEYTISYSNMNMEKDAPLYAWETRAADKGAYNENYMKNLGKLDISDGKYTITVKPYSCVTVTSLDKKDDEELKAPLPENTERTVLDTDKTGDKLDTTDGYLYTDDFEYKNKKVYDIDASGNIVETDDNYIESRGGDTGAIPRYTNNLNGAFEVYKKPNGNHVLRQQVDVSATGKGNAWLDSNASTLIGDNRWANYSASVDVLFEGSSNAPSAVLGVRQACTTHNNGGEHILDAEKTSGYALKLTYKGNWTLYRAGKKVLGGSVTEEDGFTPGTNTWNRLKVSADENVITAYINGKEVGVYEDSNPIMAGRVCLGSAYTYTEFDNLSILKIKDKVPYYSELIDNMEQYELDNVTTPKLSFDGDFQHKNGQGMYVYERSISTTKTKGDSVTFKAVSTGVSLIGLVEEKFPLKVTVDGNVIEEDLIIGECNYMNAYYSITGLDYKEHTYKFEMGEGASLSEYQLSNAVFNVDVIGVFADKYTGDVPDDPIIATEDMPIESEEPVAPSESPAESPSAEPVNPVESTEPVPTVPTESTAPVAPKKGTVITVGSGKYTITGASTAAFKAPKKNTVTSVTIPATVSTKKDGKTYTYKVTAINASAFTKCKKLKSVTIGKNIKEIKTKAFYKVKTLKKIVIKSTALKKVGNNAIKGIYKKAVIKCNKTKKAAYKKLFKKKTGFIKTMKLK